jgi:Ras-related protein Rab-18
MNSYYRGAHGIICVYDVARPETLTHIKDIWVEEIALYSTNEKAVKLLLGNKVDTERRVPTIEAAKFARDNGFLFAECSSKEGLGIIEAFELLVHRMTEDPEVWGGQDHGATRLSSSDSAEAEAEQQRSRCASYYCAV